MDGWCEGHGKPRGKTLTLRKTWELSEAWYADRLSPDYRGRTAEEVEEIFANVGLGDPFWHP